MSGGDLSFEHTKADAESKGCIIRFPKPNELFVDIDTREDFEAFEYQLERIQRLDSVQGVIVTESKSGYPRRHVVVTLGRDVTPIERIALQASLGSDRTRESLSLARIRAGNPHPTVFFERPDNG